MYIWERSDWPSFQFNRERFARELRTIRLEQGKLLGRMEALGFDLRNEAVLHTLTQDVLKSSEIEGERLDPDQVRSSVARRLGMDIGGLKPSDRDTDGVVEMMLDATLEYDQALTEERLFAWHCSLFPTGRSGMTNIRVGEWRDDQNGPMQVVSGPIGRERVHYVAPPAERLDGEMASFLSWCNNESDLDMVVKAGLAHLWFVTVHPFDDGNGRIARAIADMMLARSEGVSQRFYSMSSQIQLERNDYYNRLEATQKGDLDVTEWLNWFLGCLNRAIDGAKETLSSVLKKDHFWRRFATETLNERQTKVINRLLDGFEGKLTTSKWAKLAKCSQDTAYRDIIDLMDREILKKNPGGGRSTSYSLFEIK